MLVITRRLDEAVLIGPDITVQVVRIDGSQVRLGITAPADVLISRKELTDNTAENGRRKEPHRGT